jgi:hypothetical protein
LIVEYYHLATNYDGASSERKQGDVDILLPKVANEIDQMEYGKCL